MTLAPSAQAVDTCGGSDTRLDGLRVLLVEDEGVIAMDLQYTLEDAGATIVGPIDTLADAIDEAREAGIDLAVLDVDLHGEDVFPAASILQQRDVPFLFHTGHGSKTELARSYAAAPVLNKPASEPELLATLAELAGREPQRRAS